MSHSHEYKCRSIGFEVDGRQLRAHRRSLDRKASRDDVVMKRRSLVIPPQSDIERISAEFSILEARNDAKRQVKRVKNVNTLTPLREVPEIMSTKITPLMPPVKKMTGSDLRRLQLLKYKEQKLLKQKFQKNSKPVFKVCRVNHAYNAFAVTADQQNKVASNSRVTRSMVEKNATKVTEKVVTNKADTRQKKTGVSQKRIDNFGTSQKSIVAAKSKCTKTAQTKSIKKTSESFAPVGFKFTAPDNLYYKLKTSDDKTNASYSAPSSTTAARRSVGKENTNNSLSPRENDAKLDVKTPVKKELKSILKISPAQTSDNCTIALKENSENVYKTPVSLNNSAKKTRFVLPHEETGISPFVTTIRGSSSRRNNRKLTPSSDDISLLFSDKEVKSLLEVLDKSDVSQQDEKENVSSEKAVKIADPELISALNNFKNLVTNQREEFRSKIDDWLKTKSTDLDIPSKVIDDIDCTIGMTDLLMNQRFKQFEELISDCEFQTSEKKTMPEDLQGFWDMVEFQIEDIKGRYVALESLKDNNWYEKSPSPIKKKRPTRKAAVKASKQNKSSNIRQHIVAARKKKNLSESASISPKETKQQEASYNTPISTSIATASSRRSRLSAIFSEEGKETKLQRTPVTRSAARRSASLGYLLVPTVTMDPEDNPIVGKKKVRRSVRFTESETDKENKNENSSFYRTTPFRQTRTRLSNAAYESSDTLLSESILSVDKEQLTSDCTQEMDLLSLSSRSAKKLRKPSLLPMGNCTNTLDSSGDLMSFSPLEIKVDAKSGTVATPLRRSMRLGKTRKPVSVF